MKKKYIPILIIICLAIISMLPMLTEMHIHGHDTVFHIENIKSVLETIRTNFWLTPIASKVGFNLGYATHLFYPIFPHFVGAIILLLITPFNGDAFMALTISYTLVSILSSLIVYFLAKRLFKKDNLALLSSITYIFMPYRLGNIVVRSAYNEVFTFLFIPLILLGLSYLVDEKTSSKKAYLYFVIGYVGLIYSHLSMALFFTLLLIPFAIIYRKELFKKDKMKLLGSAILTVTLLVLPMLVPLLEHKLLGNYLVFKENYLSGLQYVKSYNNQLVDYYQILNDYSWSIPRYINWIVLALGFISLIVFFVKKEKPKFLKGILWFTLISFLITLKDFPWEYVPSFLYMIQFSWRLETFLVISLSLFVPYALSYIKGKWQKILPIGLIILVFLTSLPLIGKLSNHKYVIEETIPNNAMGHSMEYLPEKAYYNLKYLETRGEELIIDKGKANVELISNNIPELVFKVTNNTNELTIELPRLYYLGYTLKGDKVTSLQENEHGLIEVTIEGNGTYNLEYVGTTLMKISYFLPLLGIALIIYTTKKVTN